MKAAGHEKKVSNLGGDLKDSRALLYVLNQLDKQRCSLDGLNESDEVKRAKIMIDNAKAINVPDIVTP